MNGLAPPYLSNIFCKRNTIHNFDTRKSGSLQIPLCKTKTGQRSFRYRAVNIWNDLHPTLKKITSLNVYKKELKKDILTKSYS